MSENRLLQTIQQQRRDRNAVPPADAIVQSGINQAELVVARGGRDRGVTDVQHRDAILIAVGHITDVDPGGSEINDVASGGAVLERQVAQRLIGQRSGEVILGCHRDSFHNHGAIRGTIGQQHLLGATDQLAIHQRVADVEGDRLQAARVGQQLERIGVALLEHQRSGLVRVGHARQCRIVRSVVNAGEGEVDRRDLTHVRVDRESATATGHLMTHTIDVVMDGHRAEAAGDQCVSHADACTDSLAQSTSLESLAILRRGASSTGASKLNTEGTLDTSVSKKLL